MSDNENEVDESKYYCGMGPVPKGKIRAPPEYCIRTRQVRYYGIVAIDPDLLNNIKPNNLLKEQFKLRKLQDQARTIIKKASILKIIIDDPDENPAKIKKSQKKMDTLLKNKEDLIKKIKAQMKIVKNLESDDVYNQIVKDNSDDKPSKNKSPKSSKSPSKKPKYGSKKGSTTN